MPLCEGVGFTLAMYMQSINFARTFHRETIRDNPVEVIDDRQGNCPTLEPCVSFFFARKYVQMKPNFATFVAELTVIRRHIHENPELSFQEFKTQALDKQYLIDQVGIPPVNIRDCASDYGHTNDCKPQFVGP
ncbi:Aste57867_5749 [Aphanomyces stellatus]|uniref:Aste57867_5747 protein n=1 Tax=Aphanomyces stellatus TaxID=120398 RepID=A0A485KDB4_9STRA|nr:hypothetical protein As57867_005735 [Aphanomyces stellatus]KAF0709810.1 hypothetical protein As57867_005733 [Aphanomyces stellatus]VFT82778.1 Aste57867_5747 [Aphanomyces stellatus]VFT82780.1 Aste57867_5749 [Aphanomyces stellatus]